MVTCLTENPFNAVICMRVKVINLTTGQRKDTGTEIKKINKAGKGDYDFFGGIFFNYLRRVCALSTQRLGYQAVLTQPSLTPDREGRRGSDEASVITP